MKLRLYSRSEAALTLVEVLVVIVVGTILVVLLLPMLSRRPYKSAKIGCTNNLKQVAIAYHIWEGDNGDRFPMGVSVINGGSMEMVATGNVVQTFMVMSNELSTPKILCCPRDPNCSWPTNFALSNSNISYFVGVDVTNDMNPQMILSGDSNFELGGKPVKSGLLSMWTNDPVVWSATRHVHSGNLGLNDGSVQSATDAGLHNYLVQTEVATNRLGIP